MNSRSLASAKRLIGTEYETTRCGKCFIIDYKNDSEVTVIFHDPVFVTKCTMGNLRKGSVNNPFKGLVYGVGYLGIGDYNYTKDHRAYSVWGGIMERCFCERHKSIFPAYLGVTVHEEWHNFQNFAEWCYNQEGFSSFDEKGKSYHIDKDILVRGNKIYSPETCCFVPRAINNLLILKSRYRGELPIGVSKCFSKRAKSFKYIGLVNINGVQKNLGRYDTAEDAFKAYKKAKESYVKEVAERYKSSISAQAYNELLKYEVSIDD